MMIGHLNGSTYSLSVAISKNFRKRDVQHVPPMQNWCIVIFDKTIHSDEFGNLNLDPEARLTITVSPNRGSFELRL